MYAKSSSTLVRMSIVAGFHVALILALVYGLNKVHIPKAQSPLNVTLDDKVIPEPDPLPPPPDQPKPLTPRSDFIPLPDLQPSSSLPPNVINEFVREGVKSDPIVPKGETKSDVPVKQATQEARPQPRIDFNSCDKPEYPRASVRNDESGTTRIDMLVGVNGQVLQAKLNRTSGFRELDRAAINALSKCAFKFAHPADKEVWTTVDYVWNLESQ